MTGAGSGSTNGGRFRAAVIGCGVGAHHAYAYQNHPEVDLVAICDVREAAFEKLYASAGVTPGSVKTYTDYKQMLAEVKPDLVSVATPDRWQSRFSAERSAVSNNRVGASTRAISACSATESPSSAR